MIEGRTCGILSSVPTDALNVGEELAASEPLLAAHGISKRFGPVPALRGVDLELRRGEIVALAGENGSGKSTLAQILAGAIQPDEGTIQLRGTACRFKSPGEALEAGIAFVTQELTAVPDMSIAENVLLTVFRRPWSRVSRRELAQHARPLLERVGLTTVSPVAPFRTLGPGARELVEVAKALAAKPAVLILDEATTRLPDPERLFALVERLAAEGVGVLFVTQRLWEIRRLARRAVVLRDGEIAGSLPRGELSDDRLSSLMVGRELSGYSHRPRVLPGDVVLSVRELVTERSPYPVSLAVRQGEIVGLAGLVGSGRSELLETIAGARKARHGHVEVNGQVILPGSVRAAIRAGITLLPEDRHRQGLVLDASLAGNLAMASWRTLAVCRAARERSNGAAAVERFRIRCAGVTSSVRTLSGGNQQKVVIARCLAGDPRVLLLDEPTRGVDVGAREQIHRIVVEAAERGIAVLLASSDLPELLSLANRILVLCEGRLVGQLAGETATEEAVLMLAAGGERDVT